MSHIHRRIVMRSYGRWSSFRAVASWNGSKDLANFKFERSDSRDAMDQRIWLRIDRTKPEELERALTEFAEYELNRKRKR